MPAPATTSDLTGRKLQIVAQADQYREAIGLEFRSVTQRVDDAQAFIHRNKWWLWSGGVAVAGLLLFPTLRSTLKSLNEASGWLRDLRR
jgi:hypothetical protein